MLKGIKSLGKFTPVITVSTQPSDTHAQHSKLSEEFSQFLRDKGVAALPYSTTIRNPGENFLVMNGATTDWHQDTLTAGQLILWSSELPTVIRDKETREEFIPERGEVVMFENSAFEHHTQPYHGQPELPKRWFIRAVARGADGENPKPTINTKSLLEFIKLMGLK